MAENNLFKDLHVTFHWSEGDILNRYGKPYPEETELAGKDAYDFLAALISKDKEQHNMKIMGRGYNKTWLEISYNGVTFNNFRVDLGDLEFGLHNNVADSLRDRLGLFLKRSNDVSEQDFTDFSKLMDDFAKEEAAYLPDNRDLQRRLNIQPVTYLYAYSPEAWKDMPEMIQKFYRPKELTDEEQKYFFPDNTCPRCIIVESSRRPHAQMKEYGETSCRLLIPKKEREMLDFFDRSFRLEARHTYSSGEFYDREWSGFSALEHLYSCMDADYTDFCTFTSSNYYAPEQRWYLNISFMGHEIGTISYDQGSGDCILQGARMISDFCKEDPEFLEHFLNACKYNSDKTYHLDDLINDLSNADKHRLDYPLPDKETSLKTLMESKPEIPNSNSSSYDVREYLEHIRKIVMAKLPYASWEMVPVYIARELANDNLNLRTVKSMMKHILSDVEKETIAEAFKTDPETKKILRKHKILNAGKYE